MMNQHNLSSFPKMGRVRHIHFVGIGGAGMCGIAEVLHHEGYHITGSDLCDNSVIERLRSLGISIFIGHTEQNIAGADVLVRSTSIGANNPEILAASAAQIPIIPRAAMLAELMRFRYGIAIAGTHGKTTTTSLVSSLLAEGGLDPSYVIGGKLTSSGTNAKLGQSPYLVAEADESDASFLFLKPMIAVVTNIDADHMETYGDNFDTLRQTFLEFLHHLPFYGLAVLCADDPEVNTILSLVQRPVATYGFCEQAQYRALDWTQQGLNSHFTVQRPKPYAPLNVTLSLPGRHNVQNALAAIAVATNLNVSDESIVNGLAKFQGVGRRFQLLGERQFARGRAMVVDDYGHHPREILSTLDAFRRVWPDKKLIHVFQPHRYSRMQSLFQDFVGALTKADALLLMDIYAAGEQPIIGVTSEALCHSLINCGMPARLVNENNLCTVLDDIVTDDSVVLMQGAGSISQYAQNLLSVK